VVLGGNTVGAEDWLPTGPWRVVCLGGAEGASSDGLVALWESVCRRHSWHQPLLASLDTRVYAVVSQDGAVPGSWEWLRALVQTAGSEDLQLTAAAGLPAYTVSELGRSRTEAGEAERARGSRAAAGIEEVWAEVTVERAAAALRGAAALGPLEVLRAHDEQRGTDHLATLAAWLDHPGEAARAARALHVHPNTLRYRMARIGELVDLDLDAPQSRLALRLQLAALR
jgi:sugar diacid utilization regulator